MQPMAMALSKRCVYAKLHVTWPKLMLYIFPLISHTDRMRIQARTAVKLMNLFFKKIALKCEIFSNIAIDKDSLFINAF